ncbi:hypothetical protein EC973_001503 [Apophysomyces ossiformis]|uniref:Heterokaryon incompatibility domain-containing protein n=1 Tax=Apophysomyces ossiformis TaxID=679940 RepID=A0A8H7ERV0_9FUNG|nr:hypothetical protein EC973_001503 [Apophysomyces ossiformis]
MSEIVLLDTRSELNNIKCISIPFDEKVPPYYAISYRWGSHPEWKAQTPNYMASITEISQDNVIRLCELYRSEIRYLWIDAICMNPADKEDKKMAFRNTRIIHQSAERVITVPDLWYCDGMSEIVLLDTRSELNNIKCISIPFDEKVPPYYAISYRWGSHPEWKAQTPNYVASVTSISQENLIKVCELYRSKIRYMWIDVVCINQADKEHRKMAIKIMDSIYRRAERIIAVPDLCYCDENPLMEDVTKQDIEAAIIEKCKDQKRHKRAYNVIWEDGVAQQLFDKNEPGTYLGFRLELDKVNEKLEKKGTWYGFRDLDDYAEMRLRLSNSQKGIKFISRVIDEWAERAWVISERTIGVNNQKLLIHILRANAVFYWRMYKSVGWEINTSRQAPFEAIFGSKSTKYIDRLFAILPHTDYAYAVQNLVDADVCIDTKDDLMWILFDILDSKGRGDLLRYLIESGDSWCVLPLSREEDESYFGAISEEERMMIQGHFDHLSTGMELTTTPCGKRAVKFSCPVVYNLRSDPVPWFKRNSDKMVIISSDPDDMRYSGCLCLRTNDVWRIFRGLREILPPFTWKCREFLMFKEN